MLELSHSGFEIRSAQLLVGYRISNKHSSARKFDSDFIGRTRAPFPLTDHTVGMIESHLPMLDPRYGVSFSHLSDRLIRKDT